MCRCREAAARPHWRSTVTGLQAGQSQTVALGHGQLHQPGDARHGDPAPTVVTGAQILGLSPASQTVAPRASATYTVKVTNPRAPAISSISPYWECRRLGEPARDRYGRGQQSVNETLTLTSAAFAALGDYGFTVHGERRQRRPGLRERDLILAGQPPVLDPDSHALS